MARALAASLQEAASSSTLLDARAQEAADLAYARALAESEQMHQNPQQAQAAGGSRDKCSVS